MQDKRRGPSYRERYGWGLELYDCILCNDLAKLEILVDRHKIDIDAKFTEVRNKNHLDLSPIHLVAYKGYTGMLQYLYDMKCDIHLTTSTLHRTALHFSVLRHKMACFYKLLSIGANPDARDTFRNSPCHYAAEDGCCDILGVLLKHKRVEVDALDITWKTPLMKATRNGKLNAVRLLIQSRCNFNIRDKNQETAIHYAARHGSVELVNVLISSGSEINLQNQWGHTPLMEAVCYNNRDAVISLLKANSMVNLKEFKNGDTVLHIAVRKNYYFIIDQLLATGDIEYLYNNGGFLACYDAVINHKFETIKLFLKHNHDLDIIVKLGCSGSKGETLMQIAFNKGHFELLKLFTNLGFLINCTQLSSVNKSAAIQKFLSQIKRVCPLKHLCRRIIRKHTGFGVKTKIEKLVLPGSVKDFILLKGLLD